jgi:hypothetical protein
MRARGALLQVSQEKLHGPEASPRRYSNGSHEIALLIGKVHECLREALKLGEMKLQVLNEEIRSATEIQDDLREALDQIRASLNAPYGFTQVRGRSPLGPARRDQGAQS